MNYSLEIFFSSICSMALDFHIITFIITLSLSLFSICVYTHRCRSLRTSANILIINLAICDFLMMIKIPVVVYNSFHLGPALGDLGTLAYYSNNNEIITETEQWIYSLYISHYTYSSMSIVRLRWRPDRHRIHFNIDSHFSRSL